MVAKLDTKSRSILAIAAGVAGGAWCAVLGFPVIICLLAAVGATLPIWVMSRGVMNEAFQRPHEAGLLTESTALHAGTALDDQSDPTPLADVYPISRARMMGGRRTAPRNTDRLTG